MSLTPCPCCVGQQVVVSVVVVLVSTYYLLSFVQSKILPKNKYVRGFMKFIWWLFCFLLALIAIAVGVLSSNPELRKYIFSMICIKSNLEPSELHDVRCSLISQIKGKVLEIGPGPGANFKCWKDNPHIISWTGVEPNEYFKQSIKQQVDLYNITFPTQTVWLNGEVIDTEPESVDVVVGTHVLCSVEDVNQVLAQVNRVLKPGGQYYFFEHVSVNDQSLMSYAQQFFGPLLYIIANGCQFKPIYDLIQPGLPLFDVQMERFNAPIPIPFVVPHVRGIATKPL